MAGGACGSGGVAGNAAAILSAAGLDTWAAISAGAGLLGAVFGAACFAAPGSLGGGFAVIFSATGLTAAFTGVAVFLAAAAVCAAFAGVGAA